MKCQFHKWTQLTEETQACALCGRKRRKLAKKKKPTRPIKQTRIRQASKSKGKLLAKYLAAKYAAAKIGGCANCNKTFLRGDLDAHHTHGRAGRNILRFVFICRSLHTKIHANGKLAREAGWLQPEYDGRQSTEDSPKPWADAKARERAQKLGFTCR